MNSEITAVLEVTNLGAISKFALPDAWVQSAHRESAYGYHYQWHPKDEPRAMISIDFSGRPLSDADAATVKASLCAPTHKLSGEELFSLREMLRDQSDPELFAVSIAETTDAGNRHVFSVTGQYLRLGLLTNTIYIDAGGDGRVIQKVSYTAPDELFLAYSPDVQLAWSSLRLKGN